MSDPKTTILLYGRTGAGKTAQIGRLAEHVRATTGKNTRLYTADRGGIDTIQAYVDLGVIEPVVMGDSNPFIFLNNAAKGNVRASDGKSWVPGNNENIGFFAFESMRAIAEAIMAQLAKDTGEGKNVGGGANISFSATGEGQTVKVSGSNMAHFGVTQARITEEVWASQKLNARYILWTSSVSKDEDQNAAGKVLGPDVIGKALTTEVPRWFNLSMRIDTVAAQMGKGERHLLYLGNHIDVGAGGAAGLGNTRLPLDAPPLTTNVIEPADIVQALKLLDGGKDAAKSAIRARLGLK